MSNVIIIGGGPAGSTCAIYLAQAGIDIKVIQNNQSSLNKATIKNFYSINEIKGIDLFNNGINQVKELGVDVINEDVIDINIYDKFKVYTKSNVYEADYLVLAMGRSESIIEPFNKYLGCGVSLCALCDGPLYRGKKVYLTGDKETIEHTKEELSKYTNDIEIINYGDIVDLKGDDSLKEIVLKDKVIESNNLFLSLKPNPKTLYFKLGLINDNGLIKIDHSYKTNINKLYAIGDMSNKVKQVMTACSSGLRCAISIIEEIKNERH